MLLKMHTFDSVYFFYTEFLGKGHFFKEITLCQKFSPALIRDHILLPLNPGLSPAAPGASHIAEMSYLRSGYPVEEQAQMQAAGWEGTWGSRPLSNTYYIQ